MNIVISRKKLKISAFRSTADRVKKDIYKLTANA